MGVAFHLPRGTQAVVAVGGGVAVDAGKYIGFLNQLPVVAVPTAISNDGFASPGASLRVDGQRISAKAAIPFGVVIDTTVIAACPPRFTLSGIGDLISKYSAIADWKLSYHATGEAINDFSAMIALQSVENLVNHPDKSIEDLGFLQLVCGALVMSGVSMEVAGSSRPASGSEHLISHAYDRLAARPRMHGEQVGVATIATTWLQDNPQRDRPGGQTRLPHGAVRAGRGRAAAGPYRRGPALAGSAGLSISPGPSLSTEGTACPSSPCTTATPTARTR
jgi:glycerol-1-phosphate dehydrogenase [NAD(P)+]